MSSVNYIGQSGFGNFAMQRTTNPPTLAATTLLAIMKLPTYGGDFSTTLGIASASAFSSVFVQNPDFSYNDSVNGTTDLWTDGYTGWFLVALVYNGTNVKVYLKRAGAAIALTLTTGALPSFTPTRYVVGGSGAANQTTRLAKLCAWSAVLTIEELDAESLIRSPKRLQGLSFWNPNLDAAGVLVDVSGTGGNMSQGASTTIADNADDPGRAFRF